MNNTVENKPKVLKESKNKIKVDFERTSKWERFKIKYLNSHFLFSTIWYLFRLLLLIGISYVILYPFITKIMSSFMSADDLVDATVKLIPKYPTLDRYAMMFDTYGYWQAMLNTFLISLGSALLQTFVCAFISYGFAKFKFKGNKLLFAIVVLTMIIPHNTMQFAMYMRFRFFDIFGIIQLITGKAWNMMNTFLPMILLSITGLAYRNGLYIFMLRQFFRGFPDELEESAYIDGSGVFRTFFTIALPSAIPMMVTVFLFAFAWQWTDYFYTTLFFPSAKILMLSNFYNATSTTTSTAVAGANSSAASILILLPLVILYIFGQKFLVSGIERSGLTAD